MKLCFDSIEEVQEFTKKLKGTRGGKGGNDEPETPAAGQAPAPLQPPAGAFNPPSAFSPQGGATFPGTAPVGGPSPEIAALVARIVTKIDGAIAGGQPADAVLNWFKSQCGPEAANATMDQIKTVFLGKLQMPALENIAKLMNA